MKSEHQIPMRAMLLTFLALVLPALADIPPLKPSPTLRHIVDQSVALEAKGKQKGAWYLSAEGHAVFCYGPTQFIQGANGSLIQVATFCRGDRVIVPLHE